MKRLFTWVETSSSDEHKIRLLETAFSDAEKAVSLWTGPKSGQSAVYGVGLSAVMQLQELYMKRNNDEAGGFEQLVVEFGRASAAQMPALRERVEAYLGEQMKLKGVTGRLESFAHDALNAVAVSRNLDPESSALIRDRGRAALMTKPVLRASQGSVTVPLLDLRLAMDAWPAPVLQSLTSLREARRELNDLAGAYRDLSQDPDQANAKLTLLARMRGVTEHLDRAADRFAETAAEHWTAEGDGPERWQRALEYADELAGFLSPLLETLAGIAARVSAETAQASEDSTHEATPESAEPVVHSEAATSSSSSASRSRRRSRPVRTAAPQADTAATASTLLRAEVLKRADALLGKARQVTREAMDEAGGDPLVLARSLGRNTGYLDQRLKGDTDPLSIAHDRRDSFQSWFGGVARLQKMRKSLKSLPAHPDIKARVDEIDAQLPLLRSVEAGMTKDEADALKQHPFPKAQHLDRMLEMDEIAKVHAPIALRSANYSGTLFELRIDPRPLSGGTQPPSFFVHVHTEKAANARQCLALSADDCTAIHVKTEHQKALGRPWEDLQKRLGDMQAKVHRGDIKHDEVLWNRLKSNARAGSSSGRSSGGRR